MNLVQHAQFTYLYGKSGDTFQALFTQGKQGYMSRNYKWGNIRIFYAPLLLIL